RTTVEIAAPDARRRGAVDAGLGRRHADQAQKWAERDRVASVTAAGHGLHVEVPDVPCAVAEFGPAEVTIDPVVIAACRRPAPWPWRERLDVYGEGAARFCAFDVDRADHGVAVIQPRHATGKFLQLAVFVRPD